MLIMSKTRSDFTTKINSYNLFCWRSNYQEKVQLGTHSPI